MKEQEFAVLYHASMRQLQEALEKLKAKGWIIQQVIRTSTFNEPELDVSSYADYLAIVSKNE